MKLFTFLHPYSNRNKEFAITINHPIWITDDIYACKRETKRILLEMVDTYPKLVLGYSGGTDSAFVLCCIRDLINEKKIPPDTIEIVQGVFTADNIPLSMDRKRATSFAKKLGFSPKIHEYDINKKWLDIEQYYMDFCLTGKNSIVYIGQYLWAEEQDGHVICMRDSGEQFFLIDDDDYLSSQKYNNFTINILGSMWDQPKNSLNLCTWDNKIFSSFITPFRLNKVPTDKSPFDEAKRYKSNSPTNSQFNLSGLRLMEKYLEKLMLYFQCYPEMSELLGKFYTWDWSIWHHHSSGFANADRMKRFITEIKSSPPQSAEIKHPDGTLWTKKDLVNYEEHFDVS